MPCKTILVHVNDERRAGSVIDVAAHIADRHEAHLIGLFVIPSGLLSPATHYGGRLIESARVRFREEAHRIGTSFEAATKGRAIVAEWRIVEPSRWHPEPAEAIIDQGRTADLVVASQADPDWDFSLLLDVPDRLAVESGRPTLIVPHAGRYPTCGQRILVAWNGRREAVRAVFDALPLLERASAVRIISADARTDQEGSGSVTASELAATLARHGVKCEVAKSITGDISVGDDLLNRASDFGADLLVMGCYGHSRLREFVFGGASRNVLGHMTLPVLMSH